MFTSMMISNTTETFCCQPMFAATTSPVMLAAPTMLLTFPPGVLARFLENR